MAHHLRCKAIVRGLLTLAPLLIAGCLSNYEPVDTGGGADAADGVARQQFASSILPIMNAQCNACHAEGANGAPTPGWGRAYDPLVDYGAHKLFNCSAPEQSLLVTKGEHSPGVPFATADRPTIASWVRVWAEESPVCAGVTTQAVTAPFVPQPGLPSTIDLSGLGPGLSGSSLSLAASTVGGGVYLNQIRITAGPGGLHVKAPRFEACLLPPTATQDSGNAFASVDQTLGPGETQNLGQGTLSFPGWMPGIPMGIRFESLTPAGGAQGSPVDLGGSCAMAAPMMDAAPPPDTL